MFTISYLSNGEHKMEHFNSKNRTKLAHHLMQYPKPIVNVYEQASPINHAIRVEMLRWAGTTTTSEWARKYMEAAKSPA